MASTQRPTNAETVKRLYEAFNDRNFDTALSLLANDVEWTEPAGSTLGGTYHSPDGVLKNVFEPCDQQFDPFVVSPERFLDAGDVVVTLGAFHATPDGGDEIVSPFAHIWEMADGKVVRMTNYTDTALWQ